MTDANTADTSVTDTATTATDKTAATATATTDTTKTADTIVTNPSDKPEAVAPADWPSDWREKLAGEDAAFKNILSRYQSPNSFAAAYRELRKKQDSGQLKRVLSEGASEDEIKQYRKDNGIPDAPEGYLTNLPNGLVLGEDDKGAFEGFAKSMHAKNVSPEIVHEALGWYNQFKEDAIAARAEFDKKNRAENEDALRAEWGAEFRANLNVVSSFLDTMPGEAKNKLLSARAADGTLLGNDPDILRGIAAWAKEINPAHTVVPGAGANAGASIADEINALKAKMADQNSDYWQGPSAEKNQARYRQLVEAQSKMKAA